MIYLKIVVSIGLIFLLLFGVDWTQLTIYMGSMDIWFVALAFLIMVGQFPLSSIKWGVSLKIHDLEYPFYFLQKILCIGFFFNNFLPSSIGGDGYRVYKTMPDEGYKSRSLSAILLDRIVGLLALLLLGTLAGIWLVIESPTLFVANFVIFSGGALVSIVVIFVLFRGGFLKPITKKLSKIKKLDLITHNLTHIVEKKYYLKMLIIQSVVFQMLVVLIVVFLYAAVSSVSVDIKTCAVLATVIGLASIVPLSINGIGVVEGAFVVASTQLGIPYEPALVIAFMLRILVLPLSMFCGLVYLFDARKSKMTLDDYEKSTDE